MLKRSMPVLVFLALLAALATEFVSIYPRLPHEVAVHFDFHGHANRWATKRDLAQMLGSTGIAFVVLFLATAIIPRLRASIVNVPHREHWLAPRRQAETLIFLRDWLRWLIDIVLAFVGVLVAASLQANLRPVPRLPDAVPLVATLVLCIVAMLLILALRFRQPTLRAST